MTFGTSEAGGKLARSLDTAAYVQFGDGEAVHPLGRCTVVPSLPSPGPDVRPTYRSVGAGGYEQIGTEPGAPGAPSLTITTLVTDAANYLEQIKEHGCRFNLYITTSSCVPPTFDSWRRAWVYRGCRIVDDPIENVAERQTDALVTHDFSITAWSERVDHRPVKIVRVPMTTTQHGIGVGIAPARCPSDCEEGVGACQQVAVSAGDGVNVPDLYYTLDGTTWLTNVLAFVAGTNAVANAVFQDASGDYGGVVVRDGRAGFALMCETGVVGLSALVTIGESPGEGVTKDSGLFFLDARHGWICTDDGRVYFSDDGGLSWVEQPAALTASGGLALTAIHFADAKVGCAVSGGGDRILWTTDGGRTWANRPTGLAGAQWVSVWAFDARRVLISCYPFAPLGSLYMTYDAGTSWVDISQWPNAGGWGVAYSMHFLADDLTGYAVVGTGAATSVVYKSINGGRDWREIETPANAGLNSIEACQPNQGAIAGNAHGGTTFIARISG